MDRQIASGTLRELHGKLLIWENRFPRVDAGFPDFPVLVVTCQHTAVCGCRPCRRACLMLHRRTRPLGEATSSAPSCPSRPF